MGLVLALDVLQDVSFALVEPVVATTLTAAVAAPGLQTVGVASVVGLYAGTVLLINRGGGTQEAITLTAVGTNSITANFANTHANAESIDGATFPSGQPDHPLFTLQEMLAYLLDVENDFLLKTRCIYSILTGFALTNYLRFYSRPANAIRIERISDQNFSVMKNTSQADQDMLDFDWEPQQDAFPKRWYEDSSGSSNFGISPLPNAGGNINLWFSVKDTSSVLTIASTLVIPDICAHYMKYGVLARAFSKDGEQRDDFRAKYCQSRFDLGVKLVTHFMVGIELLLGTDDEQVAEFKKLVVPVGA